MTFVARFSPAVLPRHAPIGRRLRWLMLAVLCAMNACGGGLDSGGTGTQPQNTAQAVASGSIAGFGSIVVNGVHFDDRTAQITNADGAPQDTSALKLGMQVRVLSGGISETNAAPNAAHQVARAQTIRFASEAQGRVDAVDAAAGTLTVLGQQVSLTPDTVAEGWAAGVSGVRVGDAVEVFGLRNPVDARVVATRLSLTPDAARYSLTGSVLRSGGGPELFSVAGTQVDARSVTAAERALLQAGGTLRVTLATVPEAGVWRALRVQAEVPPVTEGADTRIEGFVSQFSSLSALSVNGWAVDASSPTLEVQHGNASALGLGVRVRVAGVVRRGVLQAQRIDLRRAGGGDVVFELAGRIEAVSPSGRSFVLRGSTVAVDANTLYSGGAAATLAPGVDVQLSGAVSGNGNHVLATQIRFLGP